MQNENILESTRVYLSGPMDFVGSRVIEKYLGWRAIITPIMKSLGVTVLDPWNKPELKGHGDEYGKEGVAHSKADYEKDFWTNEKTRFKFGKDFWQTVHIDLRMTDVADFLLAFVPTNIYSVGTVHEIVMARGQHKPVLMISPPIEYGKFDELQSLSDDAKKALKFYGLKENPQGLPSQWYGNIVGGHNIFDGFGWEDLDFKSPDFYDRLFSSVIENSKPDESDAAAMDVWTAVKGFVENYEPLVKLKGGVLDHVKFYERGEREMLDEELNDPGEKERRYYWYNKPYKSKRPMLYHLLCIAAGRIPKKLNIQYGDDGTEHIRHDTDDDWMLISPAEM